MDTLPVIEPEPQPAVPVPVETNPNNLLQQLVQEVHSLREQNTELVHSLRALLVDRNVQNSRLAHVKIENINMPFWAMVGLILKWIFASIPAAILVSLLGFVITLLLGGVMTGLLSGLGALFRN